jgi:signal transduction histidine kinase
MSDETIAAKLARLEDLEQRFDEVVERAKLEAMKELAYGAGHEINNPLANIATRAQTLLQDERDPERRRKLAAINAQAFRAHEMIADLMLFARPPQLQPKSIELGALLSRVADEIHEDAQASGVGINVRPLEKPIHFTGDPVQLAVALRAICTNAIEAVPNGGNIEVSATCIREGEAPAEPASETDLMARQEPRPPGVRATGAIQITVADNGPGIPPEIRPKIFDPFFSGREAGRGLGFGLSKAWRIVTLHGGAIAVRETPGGGATFVITLPFSTDRTPRSARVS